MMQAKEAVQYFLGKHQMDYQAIDFDSVCEDFMAEMEAGLNGLESSLDMLPTYISDYENPVVNESIIALDAGGTNFRVSVIHFDGNSNPEIIYFEKYPMPGTQGELDKDAFFDLMADYVAPALHFGKKIGFCFSYPSDMEPSRDGRAIRCNKEVRVTNLQGELVGANLLAALRRKGFDADKRFVLLNDTVSTLLGGRAARPDKQFDGSIGFILGTGVNTCYAEQNALIRKNPGLSQNPGKTIINMESGGYAKVPAGDLDDAFDRTTTSPGEQRLEKMIAGAYQGGLLHCMIGKAMEEGIISASFDYAAITELTTKDINEFCDNPCVGLLADAVHHEEDREKLFYLIDAVIQRAAKLVAINFAAVMRKTGTGANPCRPVCVAAEGTTFYKSRLFRQKLDYYLNKYLNQRYGLYCDIVMAENMNIIGTAIAGSMAE